MPNHTPIECIKCTAEEDTPAAAAVAGSSESDSVPGSISFEDTSDA